MVILIYLSVNTYNHIEILSDEPDPVVLTGAHRQSSFLILCHHCMYIHKKGNKKQSHTDSIEI